MAPDTPRKEAMQYWYASDKKLYVCEDQGDIVGAYFLKNNQPGLSSHIATGSILISPAARGRKIGFKLSCELLERAKDLGYHAIQFNKVVKTNDAAVNLWKKLGLSIVGTVPNAFFHLEKQDYVDVYIMYLSLLNDTQKAA